MCRVLSFDRAVRRVTPTSVLIGLLVGYACWGTYGVYREYVHVRDVEPVAIRAAASRLEHVEMTWTDLQRDFAADVFREGDPIERLLAAHPPAMVIRHPPYTTVYYRRQSGGHDLVSEVEVVAKNGKLVQAEATIETGPGEYTGVQFFGDGLLFSKEYMDSLMAGLLRWQADVETAVMAVTGAAAVRRADLP